MSIWENDNNNKFTPVGCKLFNHWFLVQFAVLDTHFHLWSWALNSSGKWLVTSTTFTPLLRSWSRLATLAITAVQSSQLSKTMDGFPYPAAFRAPSSIKRASQQGGSFLFSPNLTSPCPVSTVCWYHKEFFNGALLARRGQSAVCPLPESGQLQTHGELFTWKDRQETFQAWQATQSLWQLLYSVCKVAVDSGHLGPQNVASFHPYTLSCGFIGSCCLPHP